MSRFEYKVIYSEVASNPSLIYDLNDMGNDGWELVSISNHPFVGDFEKDIFGVKKKSVLVFKRKAIN